MLVIAYLYNTNGMATWCWEAAHALAETGRQVLLVCAPEVRLLGFPAVTILRFAPATPAGSKPSRLAGLLAPLNAGPNRFLPELDVAIRAAGYDPTTYLLNQTDLRSSLVPVPQYVVGWAYPTTLGGYLRGAVRTAGWYPSRRLLRAFITGIGWYRKDWRGYRGADGVMAVSRRLADDLTARGVKAAVVHPGTAVGVLPAAAASPSGTVRAIVTALDLDEPRKGVRFLLRAIRHRPPAGMSLTLVGKASEALRAEAATIGIPLTFAGLLPRSELSAMNANHDLFLFASRLDDWGYVLVEALAAGLWVVAPRVSPFDEIVGDCGEMFTLGSIEDLSNRLSTTVSGHNPDRRRLSHARAERLFSRPAFAAQLLAASGGA